MEDGNRGKGPSLSRHSSGERLMGREPAYIWAIEVGRQVSFNLVGETYFVIYVKFKLNCLLGVFPHSVWQPHLESLTNDSTNLGS